MFGYSLLALASFAGLAAAEFAVTYPGPDAWWVAKSANNVAWNCQEGPSQQYTVLITNTNVAVLSGPQAIIAIMQNADCTHTVTQQQTDLPPNTGYQLQLADILNSSHVYATSGQFEIKPLGSTYPSTTVPNGPTGTNGADATGASGSAGSTSTNKPSGAASLKTVGLGFSLTAAAALGYFM